ncbi:plasmid mobilization relaxosome protein MobC [Bifidobacterium aerophilum]|uniref:Plasmid mobilization relaxosome protein MobC n=1 Tax=Bifidobacterium aerophilum TaxID=1798155 RepID=A0A6N9Z6U3_9BIFI|nr:plasmid mobilization relaxosome protein MobC [Bifidobacterium aerophilum]
MAWKGNRSRRIRKSVTFSESEWRWVDDSRKVENRMRVEAGLPAIGWMAWARRRIMTAQAVEVHVPANINAVSAQLARIGNNVNQIAHAVNIRQRANHDDLMQVQQQLERIEGIVAGMARNATDESEGLPWRM